jgi:hypothetical protein
MAEIKTDGLVSVSKEDLMIYSGMWSFTIIICIGLIMSLLYINNIFLMGALALFGILGDLMFIGRLKPKKCN